MGKFANQNQAELQGSLAELTQELTNLRLAKSEVDLIAATQASELSWYVQDYDYRMRVRADHANRGPGGWLPRLAQLATQLYLYKFEDARESALVILNSNVPIWSESQVAMTTTIPFRTFV